MNESKNLKTFVSRFIQQRAVESFPHLYIVDKQTGPYRTIQEAIDAAEPNSLIKISQGFYQQNLVIKQKYGLSSKSIRLQPKNIGESDNIGVVLLANGGIAVYIKLEESDDQCFISGMKFSHSGNSDSNLKKELLEHEHILNIFEHHQNIEQLQSEFVNRMAPSKMENIIVLLQRGKATIKNCIFSLNYLVKSCNSVIPALWIQKDGSLVMTDCEVKGHESKETIGVVCRLGILHIQNCSINNHKEGGILIWGIRQNSSKIIKNLIEDNSFGVHLVGEEFKLKVISNSIRKNKVGIKVGLACEPDISRNMISENDEGIQINSAFPYISLNKIQKNRKNGIICRSYKKYICRAVIRKNVGIVGNTINGITVQGENNITQILQNHMIGFNGQAGIKVQKQSFPTITGNKIYKNFHEGILLVQDSNAVIQRNDITHNIDCNIALGGNNSHHSIVVENVISDSPGVGIYLIRASHCKVIRNDICRNENGILISGGIPEVRRNYVSENRNNGIICEMQGHPQLIQNFITRNCSIGLLLRHCQNSKAVIHSNIIVSNEIDAGMQEYSRKKIDQLNHSNTIQGQIYYPEELSCQIM